MSDLNNFIMIEDSKIHEQEQRFKDQWGTESDAIDEESPNMEAFGFGTTEVEMDERLEQLEQENLAKDLGIDFSDMEADEY